LKTLNRIHKVVPKRNHDAARQRQACGTARVCLDLHAKSSFAFLLLPLLAFSENYKRGPTSPAHGLPPTVAGRARVPWFSITAQQYANHESYFFEIRTACKYAG
jgi:hypothetical protein